MSLISSLAIALYKYFWALWALGLTGTVGAALYLDRRFPRPAESPRPVNAIVWPSAFASLLFTAFLVAYVGFMLWDEHFTYHDHALFIDFSVSGAPLEPLIWLGVGRFWPLGYQEYNLLAKVSPTATSYLALGALELLAVMTLLFLALKEEPPWARLTMLVVLMLAPAFAASYAELTYAERNVIFWFCILFFAIQRHETRGSRLWLVAGVVAAGFALYYKETAVALIGSFIASRLLLKASRNGIASVFGLPIEIGTLIACLGFVSSLAVVLIVAHASAGELAYVSSVSLGSGKLHAIGNYLVSDPLVTAYLLAFGIHLTATFRARRSLDPLWDALAIAGVLHFAAIASTGIWEDYLQGPTELVAAVTLLRLSTRWWRGFDRPGRALLVTAGVLVVLGSTGFGLFRLIERKNVVRETADLADFLVEYYRRPEALADRLYFPVATDGRIMFFLSFLRYKGLPIALSDEPNEGRIVVAGSEHFANNLCVSHRKYVCHHDSPAPGDLVVFLPEDREHADLDAGTVRFEPLIEFPPFGSLSTPGSPLSLFFRISPGLEGKPMPKDWPRASIGRAIASGPE